MYLTPQLPTRAAPKGLFAAGVRRQRPSDAPVDTVAIPRPSA